MFLHQTYVFSMNWFSLSENLLLRWGQVYKLPIVFVIFSMCCLIIPFDSAVMFSKPAISKNVANCKIFSNYNTKGEYRSFRLTLLLPIQLIPGDILILILPLEISMLFMYFFLEFMLTAFERSDIFAPP